jgi:hypothetical protein
LLIVDRSLDPVAPLMHEYTYQAAVYDMLEFDGDLIKYARVISAMISRCVHIDEMGVFIAIVMFLNVDQGWSRHHQGQEPTHSPNRRHAGSAERE